MDKITFKINGIKHSVGNEESSSTMLLDYLRTRLELHGTKYMCREGGCGACIVTAVAGTGETPRAVNSCLVSVMSCQGWDITTIEEVGNKHNGYHPIQKALAEGNGTQCGYCSPGWVMSMYSLLKSKQDLTMLEIEKSFGSNICRCTGYRPILEAFKKFAKDSPEPITDIENLDAIICNKTKRLCKIADNGIWYIVDETDVVNKTTTELNLADGKVWYSVKDVKDIFDVLEQEGDDSYMLVGGNTAVN